MNVEQARQFGDGLVEVVKGYVDRAAIARIKSLEQRIVDLEERLRAMDGQKAHIR